MKYTILLQAAQIKTIRLCLNQLFVNNNNNKLYLHSIYIINCSRGFTKNELKLKKSNNSTIYISMKNE